MRNGARRAGAGFRRTRVENGNSVQRFEARFDGLAGCLRTPAGGSSRQIVIAIEGGKVRTRLMSPREAARLMGLGEDYILPESTTAALKLCGDGVCAPLVQWLGENIFEPALPIRAIKAA
jgi:DNA (cytosine-5)-methyltransferase 1